MTRNTKYHIGNFSDKMTLVEGVYENATLIGLRPASLDADSVEDMWDKLETMADDSVCANSLINFDMACPFPIDRREKLLSPKQKFYLENNLYPLNDNQVVR